MINTKPAILRRLEITQHHLSNEFVTWVVQCYLTRKTNFKSMVLMQLMSRHKLEQCKASWYLILASTNVRMKNNEWPMKMGCISHSGYAQWCALWLDWHNVLQQYPYYLLCLFILSKKWPASLTICTLSSFVRCPIRMCDKNRLESTALCTSGWACLTRTFAKSHQLIVLIKQCSARLSVSINGTVCISKYLKTFL